MLLNGYLRKNELCALYCCLHHNFQSKPPSHHIKNHSRWIEALWIAEVGWNRGQEIPGNRQCETESEISVCLCRIQFSIPAQLGSHGQRDDVQGASSVKLQWAGRWWLRLHPVVWAHCAHLNFDWGTLGYTTIQNEWLLRYCLFICYIHVPVHAMYSIFNLFNIYFIWSKYDVVFVRRFCRFVDVFEKHLTGKYIYFIFYWLWPRCHQPHHHHTPGSERSKVLRPSVPCCAICSPFHTTVWCQVCRHNTAIEIRPGHEQRYKWKCFFKIIYNFCAIMIHLLLFKN